MLRLLLPKLETPRQRRAPPSTPVRPTRLSRDDQDSDQFRAEGAGE